MYVSGTDVYIAGSDNGYATIWKNGVPTNLAKSSSESSIAESIYVSGNDVYAAGLIWSQTFRIATWWKNGVATVLGAGDSIGYSLFVSGNDVYVAGYDDAHPAGPTGHKEAAAFWKNGVITRLDTVNASTARAIYVLGGDVYVVSSVGTFWKNGVVRNLNDAAYINSGTATSITVSGEEVFIGGSMNNKVSYWRSNKVVKMQEDGVANSIFVVKK